MHAVGDTPPNLLIAQDELLKYTRLDFLKLRRYEEVHALIEAGHAFAARRDAVGVLDRHFGGLRRRKRQAAHEAGVHL